MPGVAAAEHVDRANLLVGSYSREDSGEVPVAPAHREVLRARRHRHRPPRRGCCRSGCGSRRSETPPGGSGRRPRGDRPRRRSPLESAPSLSAKWAPTRKSGTPSPVTSPRPCTVRPNSSPGRSPMRPPGVRFEPSLPETKKAAPGRPRPLPKAPTTRSGILVVVHVAAQAAHRNAEEAGAAQIGLGPLRGPDGVVVHSGERAHVALAVDTLIEHRLVGPHHEVGHSVAVQVTHHVDAAAELVPLAVPEPCAGGLELGLLPRPARALRKPRDGLAVVEIDRAGVGSLVQGVIGLLRRAHDELFLLVAGDLAGGDPAPEAALLLVAVDAQQPLATGTVVDVDPTVVLEALLPVRLVLLGRHDDLADPVAGEIIDRRQRDPHEILGLLSHDLQLRLHALRGRRRGCSRQAPATGT